MHACNLHIYEWLAYRLLVRYVVCRRRARTLYHVVVETLSSVIGFTAYVFLFKRRRPSYTVKVLHYKLQPGQLIALHPCGNNTTHLPCPCRYHGIGVCSLEGR